jgi:hypothetical protein
LVEKFKECVHQDLRTHLEDKNLRTLDEAAVISDTYTLSHKKYCWSKNQSSSSLKGSDSDKKNVSESKSSSTSNSQSPLNSGSSSGPRSDRSEGSSGVGSLPICVYCKKRGHLISECFKLKKKMALRNHSHMLVQHLEMIGKPLFHLVLALLIFRVQSPVLLILWRIIYAFFVSGI